MLLAELLLCLPCLVSIAGVSNIVNDTYFETIVNADCYNPTSAESKNKKESNRDVTFTYFNGTSTDVDIGDNISSYFYYPRQCKYYKFSSSSRICASFNYSGPSASLRIFYSNFFADNDYLVSVPYIANSPDCYMFDKNCEYIIELAPYGIMGSTSFSFQMSILTSSNLSNHNKYIFHQIFDSSSNVGYHYQTEYYDVSTSDYTATNSYINSYSNSTSFDDKIDSNHWFYNPNLYSFSDNRRVVVDTGYSEFSSVAFSEAYQVFNKSDGTFTNSTYNRFSGTFVSETTVISCAHSIFACKYNNGDIVCTGLNKDVYFSPGINDYSSMSIDYYGKYRAYELYAPISYLLTSYNNGGAYSSTCSLYDWSICLTTNIYSGSRSHSYMGISSFSLVSNNATFSYARCTGYPFLESNPADYYLYEKTMWTSYPLESDVYLSFGILLQSSSIVVSSGNSGGPLYYKYTSVQNGQPTTYVYLLGIVSGKIANDSLCISIFYRNSALFTNIVNAVTN